MVARRIILLKDLLLSGGPRLLEIAAALRHVGVLQLPQDLAEDACTSQTELCPEELNERIAEKFESLHDTILHKNADEVARDIIKMLTENGTEFRFDLTLRNNSR